MVEPAFLYLRAFLCVCYNGLTFHGDSAQPGLLPHRACVRARACMESIRPLCNGWGLLKAYREHCEPITREDV